MSSGYVAKESKSL